MKPVLRALLSFAALGTCCFAQKWEFGGVGGGGFISNVNVTAPSGSATAGFQPGLAAGAFLSENLYSHLSGEIRYEYRQNDLYLQSGGTKVTFSGNAHMLHYDLLYHTNRKGARAQAFVAAGAGLKIFRGTGAPQAFQPLYQFGFLTRTQQLKPMASVGAGLRFNITNRVFMRVEVRDFISPFPQNVIAAPSGVKYGSILNDIVPMAGISYMF